MQRSRRDLAPTAGELSVRVGAATASSAAVELGRQLGRGRARGGGVGPDDEVSARPVCGSAGPRRGARRTRLVRFRVTAPPTALETTKPTRAGVVDGSGRQHQHGAVSGVDDAAAAPPERAPPAPRRWRRSPSAVRSRCAAGSTRPCSSRLRRTVRSGPCGGERPGSRDRRGCASAGGSRGSWPGGGCSAGRCACSRGVSVAAGRPTVGAWRASGSKRWDESPVGRHRKPGTDRGRRWRAASRAGESDRKTGLVHDTGALTDRSNSPSRPTRDPRRIGRTADSRSTSWSTFQFPSRAASLVRHAEPATILSTPRRPRSIATRRVLLASRLTTVPSTGCGQRCGQPSRSGADVLPGAQRGSQRDTRAGDVGRGG